MRSAMLAGGRGAERASPHARPASRQQAGRETVKGRGRPVLLLTARIPDLFRFRNRTAETPAVIQHERALFAHTREGQHTARVDHYGDPNPPAVPTIDHERSMRAVRAVQR